VDRVVTVSDVAKVLGLEVVAGAVGLTREVTGGYSGDLLSDVMARAKPKDLWITIQGHQNIVAVALLTEVAGIIVSGGIEPERDTLDRADREGIPVLCTPLSAFQVAWQLHDMLV
jgi:predicted transcriptional regulator